MGTHCFGEYRLLPVPSQRILETKVGIVRGVVGWTSRRQLIPNRVKCLASQNRI
jgi:hypothetical protein